MAGNGRDLGRPSLLIAVAADAQQLHSGRDILAPFGWSVVSELRLPEQEDHPSQTASAVMTGLGWCVGPGFGSIGWFVVGSGVGGYSIWMPVGR